MKKKIILMTLFLLLIDISTKLLIDYKFNLMETREVIVNFFSITKVYNTGASWNILAGFRPLLIVITLIVLVIIYRYQKTMVLNNRNILTLSLLYSGIIGNLIDRIFYGYVIDFLDFTIFNYNYPVFNFADICIVFGILLLIIEIIKKEDNNEFSSK